MRPGGRIYATSDRTRNDSSSRQRHQEVGPFAALAIAQYEESEDVYLFYCDQQWNVITDLLRFR